MGSRFEVLDTYVYGVLENDSFDNRICFAKDQVAYIYFNNIMYGQPNPNKYDEYIYIININSQLFTIEELFDPKTFVKKIFHKDAAGPFLMAGQNNTGFIYVDITKIVYIIYDSNPPRTGAVQMYSYGIGLKNGGYIAIESEKPYSYFQSLWTRKY